MKNKKKTVIINKKRFSLFLIIVFSLITCGFSSVKSCLSGENQKQFISVFVGSGDTLWNIAADNNYNNKDLRKLVHEIKKINCLDSNTIYSGDELLIPMT